MDPFSASVLLCLVFPTASPPVTALAFAPDGKSFVVGSQAGVEVRSWPDGKTTSRLPTKLRHVHDLAFSPKGDVLAVAGGRPGERGEVELYRWPAGTLLSRTHPHKDLVYAVAFSPDGKHWATASADRTCQVHDLASGKEVSAFTGHSRPVLALCFTPDGNHILSGGVDQTIRLWEADTGKAIRSLDNHTGAVHALALRPQEDPEALPMLASASADKTVRLWQPTIGRLVRFARLPERPLTVAWSADGARLLAGCIDGQVRVIDPDTVRIVSTRAALPGWVYSLAAHRKGDVLAGGPEGKVVVLPKVEGGK
jgi:WD40 repeat protein